MQLIGKVTQVLPITGGTSNKGNEWQLKTVIVETVEKFPRKVAVEIFGAENIEKFNVDVDKTYTIQFDIESREFNGRWYTSVRAWKIEEGVKQNQSQESPSTPAQPTQPAQPVQQNIGSKTGLPF